MARTRYSSTPAQHELLQAAQKGGLYMELGVGGRRIWDGDAKQYSTAAFINCHRAGWFSFGPESSEHSSRINPILLTEAGQRVLDERQHAKRSIRLTPVQAAALVAVADGRVSWGDPYPRRTSSIGRRGIPSFMIDGTEVYGSQKSLYSALEAKGLIAEDVDENLPERPSVPVLLTEQGKQLLARVPVRVAGDAAAPSGPSMSLG